KLRVAGSNPVSRFRSRSLWPGSFFVVRSERRAGWSSGATSVFPPHPLLRAHRAVSSDMPAPIRAYAAATPGASLTPFSYDPGPLHPDQVEVEIIACGICHSDLHMLSNDWGSTKWPFVPGHEGVGKIIAVGERVSGRQVGQIVGIGWYVGTCGHCASCVA